MLNCSKLNSVLKYWQERDDEHRFLCRDSYQDLGRASKPYNKTPKHSLSSNTEALYSPLDEGR